METEKQTAVNCETGENNSGNEKSTLARIFWFSLAVAAAGAIIMLPIPEPLIRGGDTIALSWNGKAVLALLVAAIILWVTEVVPFSVTALLVLLAIPALGVEKFKEVIRLGFGNQIIAFFIGVLILSSAFTRTGMGKRLSLFILRIMGTRTRMVILGFLIAGTMLSMWITDMAVAAMLMPLGVSILRQSNLKPLESNFGRGLMISCAWGPLFGGIATPSGCGPNPIAISFLRELANVHIDFLTWMSLGLPASLLMIPGGWFIITRIFPPEIDRIPITRKDIDREKIEMGSFSKNEILTGIIFAGTITAWLTTPLLRTLTDGAVNVPMQAVALGGAMMLFLPGISILSWKDAQEDVDWGGIVLICAGVALGMVVYSSGAARWLSWILLGPVMSLPEMVRVFVIVIVVSILHIAFSSNTVTGTIIIPLLIALAHDCNINPWIICAPAAFTSSLAFILVTETPTNIIPYSSGYFSIRDMAKAGVVMTVAAAFCVGISILVFGSLSGNY